MESNLTSAATKAPTQSPVGRDNGCSGIWSYGGITGYIPYTTPKYEDNVNCVLVVRTVVHNQVVQVHFNRFEMEDSDNCKFDSLKIYSGEREDSASLGGPYCSTSLDGRTILSSGNTMRLVFKTDQSLSFLGFQAIFTFLDMDHLNTDCGCSMDGVCVVHGFEKMCIPGYRCRVHRCENGATCVNTTTVDRCYCAAGYTGQFCNEVAGSVSHLKFTQVPQSRTVEKGGKYEGLCQVEKPPSGERVIYEWYFDEQHFQNRANFGDSGTGMLLIDDFNKTFQGKYTCVARAGNSTAVYTMTLSMVDECLLEMQGPSNVDEDTGNTVIMSCSADGADEIWWEKDSVKIKTDYTGGKFNKMPNNYLRIANVETQDFGLYTCVAQDTKGCESRRSATLNRGKYEQYCGIAFLTSSIKAELRD